MLRLKHSPRASTPGGLPGADLRPRVEALLGVGPSQREVGVLDLDTGVVDFSFYSTRDTRLHITVQEGGVQVQSSMVREEPLNNRGELMTHKVFCTV